MLKKPKYRVLSLCLMLSLLFSSIPNSSLALDAQNENLNPVDQTNEAIEEVPEEKPLLTLITQSLTMVVDDKLSIQIDPENSTLSLSALEFKTSVDSKDGIVFIEGSSVTALAPGKVRVEASLIGTPDVLASFEITVVELEGSISIQAPSLQINRGASSQLSLNISDSLKGKAVLWESSNPGIVEVSQSGQIKAKKIGEVSISARIGKFTSKITIKVLAPLQKVDFNGDRVDLSMGDVTTMPSLIYVPYDTTSSKNAVYTSSDESIFTIEDQQMVAQRVGQAELIALVAGIETRISVVVSPAKNSQGAEVFTLNQYEVYNGELIYRLDNMALFVSDKIALEFDEVSLLEGLSKNKVDRIKIVLPKRLNDNRMAVLSSFIMPSTIFEALDSDELHVRLTAQDETDLITYTFKKNMESVDLRFKLEEIEPTDPLYPSIQTKSYRLESYNKNLTQSYRVSLPGRWVSTKSGQMHFLYTYDGEKLINTKQTIMSDSGNIVSFEVSSNTHVLTFNKIAVISNRGLLYTLGGVLLLIVSGGLFKAYKRYKK